MRRIGRLYQELLRLSYHRSHLFCHIRSNGPVRPGQRGRRRPDETPGGVPQTGKQPPLTHFNTNKSPTSSFKTIITSTWQVSLRPPPTRLFFFFCFFFFAESNVLIIKTTHKFIQSQVLLNVLKKQWTNEPLASSLTKLTRISTLILTNKMREERKVRERMRLKMFDQTNKSYFERITSSTL